MAQQPNIELENSDLPRPVATRGPEPRWHPERPGDLHGPGDMPWGGAFGTIGPDTGYVLVLIAGRELDLAPGEHRHQAETGVATLAAARASHFGRAPTIDDVDVAAALLGYETQDVPAELIADLATDRADWLANLGHDAARARALVASVPLDVLAGSPEDIRRRMAAGERLLTR